MNQNESHKENVVRKFGGLVISLRGALLEDIHTEDFVYTVSLDLHHNIYTLVVSRGS